MSKSELLAKTINKEEIEEHQKRINENSKLINEMANKLANDYCKNLNDYVTYIDNCLQDTKHPPTAEELDSFCLNLPVLLYFCRRSTGKYRYSIRRSKSSKTRKI